METRIRFMPIHLESLGQIDLLKVEPVVSCICEEPEGDIERFVRLMPITPDNIKHFWNRAKTHRTLFFQEIKNFEDFIHLILQGSGDSNNASARGLFWVVDDFVGMFYMTKIIPGQDASVHFLFFDGRFKGRVELTKSMLNYAFQEFDFHRLSVQIPVYVKPNVVKFVKDLGFQFEGKLMKKVWFDNKWFDLSLFGLLQEERMV